MVLLTACRRPSHRLYLVIMRGANKVLLASLTQPSDRSRYLSATTPLPEGSLEGCAHMWSVRAAGEWERSGRVDVFVSAVVIHPHCIRLSTDSFVTAFDAFSNNFFPIVSFNESQYNCSR